MINRQSKKLLLASSVSLLPILAAPAASAQIEEIIVTATKRATLVREVPVAITAMSGDFTRDVGMSDVKDLVTFTPGVTGNTKDSFIDFIAVRGVKTEDFGVGGDPSVAFFKNGLYQGRTGAVVSSLYDMDRAELLRGPQGFLFGRNAITGAISVHTKRPDFEEQGGYLSLNFGDRGRQMMEGAINYPFNDNFAVRIAGFSSKDEGYVKNYFDHTKLYPDATATTLIPGNEQINPGSNDLVAHDKSGARLSADFRNGPLNIQFTAEYEDRLNSGTVYRATEKDEGWETLQMLYGLDSLGGTGRDIDSDLGLGEWDDGQIASFGLNISYDLGWAEFVSSTGYKDHTFSYREDFDGTPLAINHFGLDQKGTYFEQEFRLVGQSEGPFSWYGGVSYYKEDLDARFTAQANEEVMCTYYYYVYYGSNIFGSCMAYYGGSVPEGLVEQNLVEGKYEGYAAYVDLSYDVNETVDISVGARYAVDKKEFGNEVLMPTSNMGPYYTFPFTTDGMLRDDDEWSSFTPRFVARWRPDDDNIFFGSIARGYKSGGYGTFAFKFTDPTALDDYFLTAAEGGKPQAFGPEKVWSYEIGHRGEYMNNRIITDVTAYRYDYEDLQFLIYESGGAQVRNLGEVVGRGIESAVTVLFSDHFDVNVNLAWNKTEVTDVVDACGGTTLCEGNSLPAPEWSGSAIFNTQYPAWGGEMFGRVEIFWESEKGGGLEHDPVSVVDSFKDISLRLGYRADNWSVTAYVENALDTLYYDYGQNNDGIIPARYFGPSQPRTIGVRMQVDF